MKRSLAAARSTSKKDDQCTEATPKKRAVIFNTFQKWQREFDKELRTMTCETRMTGGKRTVEILKCKVCTKIESKIDGRKNFSSKWIRGLSLYVPAMDQHTHAMTLLKQEQTVAAGLGSAAYMPILPNLSTGYLMLKGNS